MICKNCNMYHMSCKDLQEHITELTRWKQDALVSLRDWEQLGNLLIKFFPLEIGDNIPKTLYKHVEATALTLRRILFL